MGKKQRKQAVFFTTLIGLAALAGTAWADCGSIPFTMPILEDPLEFIVPDMSDAGRRKVTVDPLRITVFEPKQRALICWNGAEQILLLSTDQRASEQSAILEVIPLPSEPRVRLGSFETFEAAQRLVVEKRMWACAHGGARADAMRLPEAAGRITFHEKMGAHDLAVAEVRDSSRFVEFVQGYLKEQYKTPNAPIRPEFVEIIQSYVDGGFRWFAFDVIQLGESTQSRQPIEYRFKTDTLFYPLRISTLERGRTEVEHLVFTPNDLTFVGTLAHKVKRLPVVSATRAEVEALDKTWQGFFGQAESLAVNQWTIEGKASKMVSDLRAR